METVNTFVNQASISGFAALLLVAAWSDVKHYLIPNSLVLGVSLLYPVYALSAPQPVDWLMAVAVAGGILAVGIVLFALKRFGAGDIKLLAAAGLWAGVPLAFDFLVLTALAGGAVSLARLLRLNYGWVISWPAVSASRAVPYGVAIAAGGLYVAARLLMNATQV